MLPLAAVKQEVIGIENEPPWPLRERWFHSHPKGNPKRNSLFPLQIRCSQSEVSQENHSF